MTKKSTIKDWSHEDRPREKLLIKGSAALSESELIAILIGSGNRDQSAVELSRTILQAASDNLHELSRWDINDLMQYKGIGEAKAISIVAALEIGRRKALTDPLNRKVILSSREAYQAIYPILADLKHEEFWVIYLHTNKSIISKVKISSGGTAATVVDVKIILKKAVTLLAASLILVHNHPSGSMKPSRQDISLTAKIKEAVSYMDIILDDHLIITQSGYYSFADEGMI